MQRKKKYVRDSVTTMTEIVFPNDTNPLNGLMGGKLMHWMDIVSAIVAQKHCNHVVVTASVDNITFKHLIPIGNVVTLQAQITRAFNSSMEVYIEVWAEDIQKGHKYMSNTAFFTFVGIGKNGSPVQVPEVVPEGEREKELYEGALKRRKTRIGHRKIQGLGMID
jgi:acyl-CoA hydrolase